MRLRIGLLSSIALLLIGCGGGGGGSNATATAVAPAPPPPTPAPSPPTQPPPPGVQQTFVFRDFVSSLPGAICPRWARVPGYSCPGVDSAVATVDGQPIDIARLRPGSQDGHIALVRGSATVSELRAEATQLDIQHAVIGDIETTDPARAQLSVLGQRIQVLATTLFYDGDGVDSVPVHALVPTRRIAVSGYFTADDVVATAIHDEPGTGYLLRGILQRDSTGGFRIGALQLELSSADAVDFPGGTPDEGDVVLVRAHAAPVDSVLQADSIRFVGDDFDSGTGDYRFFAGLVSSRPSATQLEIEGRRVDCATFRCEHLAQAEVGRFVALTESQGGATTNVLTMGWASYEITGRVSAIDAPRGSLTALGFPVHVPPATVVIDAQAQADRLSGVRTGDTVTVIADLVGNALVADLIRTSGTGQSIVWNYPDGFSSTPELRVLGRTFVAGASTPIFEDCIGERNLEWLLDTFTHGPMYLIRIEVADQSPGPIAPVRIDVDKAACNPWIY